MALRSASYNRPMSVGKDRSVSTKAQSQRACILPKRTISANVRWMQSAAQASDMIPIPDHANDLFYPDTDGRPMAESDFQREPLSYAISALRRFFHDQDDIYVSGNLLIYYEQGNPKASVAPDVFVVRGAPGHDRRIYKLWEEPKAPVFRAGDHLQQQRQRRSRASSAACTPSSASRKRRTACMFKRR